MQLNVANDLSTHVREMSRTKARMFVVDDDISVRKSLRTATDLAGQHNAASTRPMLSGQWTSRRLMEVTGEHNLFGSVRDYVATQPVTCDRTNDSTSTVFVIDDDVSVRESLEPLIRTAGWHAESFASAEEFLCRPRGTAPCCLIVDLTLPGLSGLGLQKQLAGRPDVPIIFVTGHPDVPMAVEAMKAGAIELLTKPIDGIALLHATGVAIEHSRAALRRESEMRMLRNRYATLTPREREVMVLVVSGLLNKQVGFELGISEPTVKAHRGQVMGKMQAESLPDLVTMATRLGLPHLRKH